MEDICSNLGGAGGGASNLPDPGYSRWEMVRHKSSLYVLSLFVAGYQWQQLLSNLRRWAGTSYFPIRVLGRKLSALF